MKKLTLCIGLVLSSTLISCTNTSGVGGWKPVVTSASKAPVAANDVLIMDSFPLGDYANVGHFEGPAGKTLDVSDLDVKQMDYFKTEAAKMGGNTVVIRKPRIAYRSSEGQGTKVDVLYVREEIGTHGGDEQNFDSSIPLDEESFRIY